MNEISNLRDPAADTVRYVVLHGKYFVHEQLVECVRFQLGDVRCLFRKNEVCTARKMCGEPFWDLLTKDERRLIGSVISHLTKVGAVPLEKVSKDRSYPNRYELLEGN